VRRDAPRAAARIRRDGRALLARIRRDAPKLAARIRLGARGLTARVRRDAPRLVDRARRDTGRLAARARRDAPEVRDRIQAELRQIRQPGFGFWGSRPSLLLGLTLALLGTLGAAVWASASGSPGRGPDGTVVAGAEHTAYPVKPVLTAASEFVYPGGSPKLDWPSSGSAAVEVEGMGLLGNDGSMTARAAIASITKTMTAYVVLKDHPLNAQEPGPTITVSAAEAQLYGDAIAKDESAVPLQAGERLTERQALEAMLLASAGDMADLLAEWDRGSVPAFAAEMNAQAKVLGMTGTDYTDPTGLAASTVSTMADQLVLAEAIQQVPVLTAIVAENSAQVPVAGEVQNVNRDLGSLGIDGIKTGTTAAAGSCLLFSATVQVGGQTLRLLGIVLGMPGSTGVPWSALKAAETLVASAEAAIGTATVAAAGRPVAALEQDGHRVGRLGLAAPLTVVGWPGLSYRVTLTGTGASPRLVVTRTGGSSVPLSASLTTLPLRPPTTGKSSTPAKSAAAAAP
jgi:D-alanyl-D-alanine carboxypeptidase (penicillin-binding protein 5/6)